MFTGIIEERGQLSARDEQRFTFSATVVTKDVNVGQSIAVNGCCLTVVDHGDGWWLADVVDQTLSRTNLSGLRPGDEVNMERPVRVGGRLDGHIVQGHVDGVGEVLAPAPELQIRAPDRLSRYIVEKGSVAVDGCSLTVTGVDGDVFGISVVPHTVAVTTLGRCRLGDKVNLEVDLVAKYVESLLTQGRPETGA